MSTPERTVEHYVSKEPFDPFSIEALTPEQEKYYLASQWQLMWMKFIKHKLAIVGSFIVIVLYVTVLFGNFML